MLYVIESFLDSRSFNETMHSLGKLNYHTKLSSAGLVYLHYGKQVLASITQVSEDDAMLPGLYDKIYEKFIEAVDGVDNGIDQYEGTPR